MAGGLLRNSRPKRGAAISLDRTVLMTDQPPRNMRKYRRRRRRKVDNPVQRLGIAIIRGIQSGHCGLQRQYRTFLGDLEAARAAVAVLQATWEELDRAVADARKTANWAYNEEAPARLPITTLAEAVNRDTDKVREALFDGMDPVLVRMVFGGKGYTCPFCRAKH